MVVASEHRSQHRNRVPRASGSPTCCAARSPHRRPARPTSPTRGSQRRRLEAKKQRGPTKSLRGRVTGD